MGDPVAAVLARLPGKDCGQCGFRTCAGLAELAAKHPDALRRCIHLEPQAQHAAAQVAVPVSWRDMLDREFDFVLEQFPGDRGPRETILPFNPGNVERLGIRKGDILRGRPAAVGCPVVHVGEVVEDPDYFNGLVVWCVVGPLAARAAAIDIGSYTTVAYEGIVHRTRVDIPIGRRYFFLPQTCMLQSRHSGVATAAAKHGAALRVRLEGIWIA